MEKKIIFAVLSIPLLIMCGEIITVPNYQNGRTDEHYSPDGRYKVDIIGTQNNTRIVRVVTSMSDGTVEAIAPLSIGFKGSVNPQFLCNNDNSKCYKHVLGVDEEGLYLPPSPWAKLHAWLVIKFKKLENPNLKIMGISKKYPPVSQNSNRIIP